MEPLAAVAVYADLLREGESALGAAGVPTPRLDAEVLLATAAGIDRTRLLARLRESVAGEATHRFREMIERRRRREPVAYVTGVREFWSLPIEVTPAVLIPRAETELLVEVARELLAARRAPLVCDAGTGSGCIAVALARELPHARVIAFDASRDALEVARRNASRLGVGDRVAFACADWLEAVGASARFDAIVSNPPYMTTHDLADAEVERDLRARSGRSGGERRAAGAPERARRSRSTPGSERDGAEAHLTLSACDIAPLQPELGFEPRAALAAGFDGLDSMRRLFQQAPARLGAGGWIAVEFGFGQVAAVREIAAAVGLGAISVRDDLAGIPRVLVARARPNG